MNNPIELGSAVVKSLADESVAGLVKEYAEVGFDAVLSDGLLKDLPLVNTIVALGKLGVSISDRLLL
jgi:hypothetical protein